MLDESLCCKEDAERAIAGNGAIYSTFDCRSAEGCIGHWRSLHSPERTTSVISWAARSEKPEFSLQLDDRWPVPFMGFDILKGVSTAFWSGNAHT